MNEDYKSARKAYESVAGEFGNGKHKRWVIDIDFENPSNGPSEEENEEIKTMISDLKDFQIAAKYEPLTEIIKTKNGIHIITNPFDARKFTIQYSNHDLHKNNPTILYF